LLREVEDFARQNGYKQLSLFTTPFLIQAISMYQSDGFRFTGETANPHGTRLLHMVKALDMRNADYEASQL
jgi:ribosomal protein S18 acetylase RimI-like enzyme